MNRRNFLKTSLYLLKFLGFSMISFSQTNPDVVAIGAGSSGLAATVDVAFGQKMYF